MNSCVKVLFFSTSSGFLPSAPINAPSIASPFSLLETQGKFQTILSNPFFIAFFSNRFCFRSSISLDDDDDNKVSSNFEASSPCKTIAPYSLIFSTVSSITLLPYTLSSDALDSCVVHTNNALLLLLLLFIALCLLL